MKRLYLDISWQVSQLAKSGKSSKNQVSAMAVVDSNKNEVSSIVLFRDDLLRILDYYSAKGVMGKTAFVKVHSLMIFLCLEDIIDESEEITICKDFNPTILTRELYFIFSQMKSKKIRWCGGCGDKSLADKFANKIRKNPHLAMKKLTLEKIKDMETPPKSK